MANREPVGWITVNGQHIPIFEGESKADAVRRHTSEIVNKNEDDKKKQLSTNFIEKRDVEEGYKSRALKSAETGFKNLSGQPYEETDKHYKFKVDDNLNDAKDKVLALYDETSGKIRIEYDYRSAASEVAYFTQNGNRIAKYSRPRGKRFGTLTVYKKK